MERRGFLRQAVTAAGSATLVSGAGMGVSVAGAADHAPLPAASQATNGGESRRLAEYAASIRYEDIPAEVLARARDCITDTVAVQIFGARLPWSGMIAAYARQNGAGGRSGILGMPGVRVHPPSAALANGAFAHAFELDSLTQPNSGSHPGATMLSSALAVAQDRGLGGRDLLTAFVAGAEVMIRVGVATRHSNEEHGFHAPGTTGPFGSSVAVGRLLGMDAPTLLNAMGIAGSLAGGILEFARSGTGAMVKRLHLGRAAEAGVLATSLAAEGFTGPVSVLEGEFGFLRVFCRDYDVAALTRGLGEQYATRSILMKRYACHITAHTPVEATLELRDEHRFGPADVDEIRIAGTQRMVRVNNIAAPRDLMMAQYGIPFCVALALHRDPVDPRSFDDSAVRDPSILGLAARVRLTLAAPPDDRADLTTTVTVRLKDGREFTRRAEAFRGTPQRPMSREQLREKFLMLTRESGEAAMSRLFDRLQSIETERDLDWISA